MKTLTLALVVLLAMLAAPQRGRSGDAPSEIVSLTGIGKLDGVLVQDSGAISAKLSSESLRAEVEAILNRAGLLSGESIGWRLLRVQVGSIRHADSNLYAFSVNIDLLQRMAWGRPMPPSSRVMLVPPTLIVPTWNRRSIGFVTESGLEPVRETVRDLTNAFVLDYQLANNPPTLAPPKGAGK